MNPFDGAPVKKKLTPKEKNEVLQLLLDNPEWLAKFRSLLNIPSGGGSSGGGSSGDMLKATYDPASIAEQVVGLTTAQTLTNKRTTARITSITSSATPTINTDSCDAVTITALATAITSMTSNLSGTPNNFDELIIRIKDNGTARAITWGASFVSEGGTLPTTTTLNKVTTVGFIYDSVKIAWGCVAAVTEA